MPNVTEIYNSLIDDPDIVPPENVSKEQYVSLLAKQRVKQYENNERALNLGLSKLLKYSNGHSTNGHTAVNRLSSFLTKAQRISPEARIVLEDKGYSDEAIDDIVSNQSDVSVYGVDHANNLENATGDDVVDPQVHMERMAAREGDQGQAEVDDDSPAPAWPNTRAESNAHRHIRDHLIDQLGEADGEAELKRLIDEEGLGTGDNRPSGIEAARNYVDNMPVGEMQEPEEAPALGSTGPAAKLRTHLENLGVSNARDLVNSDNFRNAFKEVYGGDGLDSPVMALEPMVDGFIEYYDNLEELQNDDGDFQGIVNSHMGNAAPTPPPEEEEVAGGDGDNAGESFSDRVRREAEANQAANQEAGGNNQEPESEPEPEPAPQPEGEIEAEVGDNWDTAIDPARAGGVRYAVMYGLIDTEGKITPTGKKFFDGISGLYNDARKLVTDNPEKYENWRKQPRPGFPEGYASARNPIRDDHRLSGTALNSLIGQYNRAGGRDAAGKLRIVNNVPRGVRGADFIGHEEVTPIEGVQSPSPEDMHIDKINHKDVLRGVLRGHINDSAEVDLVMEFLGQDLQSDHNISEDQAQEIVNQAQDNVNQSQIEDPPERPPEAPSDTPAEQLSLFDPDFADQVIHNVEEVANEQVPDNMENPRPEPSIETWQGDRQLPLFENLVSDEQAAKWGLAGDAYSGVDGASKLIEQFNQAGIAARAADGESEDKYDIPAPKPEQPEMDLGPTADQPVERESLADAGRQQQQEQRDKEALQEVQDPEYKRDMEQLRGKYRAEAERKAAGVKREGEQMPLVPQRTPEEQAKLDESDRYDALSPEARKREDRIASLKEVMDEGHHRHLDDPDAYDDKEIDKLWEKHVRDPSAKTKQQIADDAQKKTTTDQKENKAKAKEASKNVKDAKAPDAGEDVKFDREKALKRLAQARHPDFSDSELEDVISELDAHYDPSIGMTDKDLESDLKASLKLNANQTAEKNAAAKNKKADHSRQVAQSRLNRDFKSPDEYKLDEKNNPDADDMSAEHATDKARDLLTFWHENIDAFKDSEQHIAIGQKLKEYLDVDGVDSDALDNELIEMEEQGILGDKDKMKAYHDDRKLKAKKEETAKDVHSNKLEQAIKNVHADRSSDEDGNIVHNRMDHAGDHEQVSAEDAGIEHTDSETPHLGFINAEGDIDQKAQDLYHELHEAEKAHPHSEAKLKRNKANKDHADRLQQNKKSSQERLEAIESDKKAAHEQNNKDRDEAHNNLDRQTAEAGKALKDEHDSNIEAQNNNHDERQNHLDSLAAEHADALDKHATQSEEAHNAHEERTKAISERETKNIKSIASDALNLHDAVDENHEQNLAQQEKQREQSYKEIADTRDKQFAENDAAIQLNRDNHKESTNRMLEANQAMTDNLEALAKRHQTELDMHQGDEAALKDLREKHAADYGKMKNDFQTKMDGYQQQASDFDDNLRVLENGKKVAEETHASRKGQIDNLHNQALKKLASDKGKARAEIDATHDQRLKEAIQSTANQIDDSKSKRDNAINDADKAKKAVEDDHLDAINYIRDERGEKPLTGKQDIAHQLDMEKGAATEVHEHQISNINDEHEQKLDGHRQQHENGRKAIDDDHKKKEVDIDNVAKDNHKANDTEHNNAVDVSDKQRKGEHNEAFLLEGDQEDHEIRSTISEAAKKDLVDHMKENGATEDQIANALANPHLGKNAAANELDHEEQNKGEHTEEEQRDGNEGQTRMVDDPNNPGEKKMQVWVPGRGKGWVDKDSMDSATGDNMKAAGGGNDGKMVIYPQGAEGNPFDGPMAGHGGNWHSIHTDNPMSAEDSINAGHDHEDLIAHHLGNTLKDHEGMKGTTPFEVNASDHGFSGSPHGAVNKRDPKKTDMKDILRDPKGVARSQVLGEGAQARASDIGSQLGVKQFTGAMDWLKQKASQSELGAKMGETYQREKANIKRDIAREKASSPPSLAEGLRAVRHRRERIGGGKYARMGFAQGFGPDKQGKATGKSEAARFLPNWLKPKKYKALHDREDRQEKESAQAKMDKWLDDNYAKHDEEQRYKK